MVIDDTMIAFGNLHSYHNYVHRYAILEIITPFRNRFSSINDSQKDQMDTRAKRLRMRKVSIFNN